MELKASRQLVLKKLQDCFPDTDIASAALTSLDTYGVESWHGEKDRVQLAILKLSAGELDKLHSLVDLAKADYRDVLGPAEYPGELNTHFNRPTNEMEGIRQRDRAQYLRWLGSDGQ